MREERLVITSLLRAPKEQQREFFRASLPDVYFKDYTDEYTYLTTFYERHNKAPDIKTFKAEFPSFSTLKTPEPIDYYMGLLQRKSDYENLRKFQVELTKHLTKAGFGGVDEAKALLMKQSEQVHSTAVTSDVDYKDTLRTTFDLYRERCQTKATDCVEWPFDSIMSKSISPGLFAQDFHVMIGRPKIGKSWLMLVCAIDAWLQGHDVLFITKEMSKSEVIHRMDAILFGLDYNALIFGRLPKSERLRLKKQKALLVKNIKARFIISDQEDTATADIRFAESKIREYNTFANFVDSAHLFFGLKSGVTMTEDAYRMSRQCKMIARRTKTAFSISVQAGRENDKARKQDNYVAAQWADAFEQDANVVTENHGDRMKPQRIWSFRRLRSGSSGDIHYNFQFSPATDFSEMSLTNAVGVVESDEIVITKEG